MTSFQKQLLKALIILTFASTAAIAIYYHRLYSQLFTEKLQSSRNHIYITELNKFSILEIAQKKIRVIDYKLKGLENPPHLEFRVPPKWNAKDCDFSQETIDTCFPYNLKQHFLQKGQKFSSWVFRKNLQSLLSAYRDTEQDKELLLKLIEALLKEGESHTIDTSDGKYIAYPFSYTYPDGFVVGPNWVSSFNNAMFIDCYLQLYLILKDEKYLQVAKDLFRPFLKIYESRDIQKEDPFFSFLDSAHFLWFEEVPNDKGALQPHILNGHIHTLSLLVNYAKVTKDETALKLIQAGATTIRNYANEYRIKNKKTRYDLWDTYHADYGPLRAVNQQMELFELTGDSFFEEMAQRFAQDNNIQK